MLTAVPRFVDVAVATQRSIQVPDPSHRAQASTIDEPNTLEHKSPLPSLLLCPGWQGCHTTPAKNDVAQPPCFSIPQ